MAKAALNLKSKTARAKLAVRVSPHYTTLSKGLALGYRRQTEGKSGVWVAKVRIDGKTMAKTIGQADDLVRADGIDILTHDEAVTAAHALTASGALVATRAALTVHGCIDAWCDTKRQQARSPKATENAEFNRQHLKKAFEESLLLADLTEHHVRDWFEGHVDTTLAPDRVRARWATAGRYLASLKAALTASAPEGMDQPWRKVKRPGLAKVGKSRTRVLTKGEENALISAADPMLARFVRFCIGTGCRMGEAGSLDVADIDLKGRTAYLQDGKTGGRPIHLSASLCERIEREGWIGNRSGSDPFLFRQDGARWIDGTWLVPFREAALRAQVEGATAYAMRHTFITRCAEASVPIEWVSKQVGSSVGMLMQTYVHFSQGAADRFLEQAGM